MIVDYGAGNLRSVEMALNLLAQPFTTTDDPEVVHAAQHVIVPGVGSAGAAMKALKERHLDEALKTVRQPVLGICLGAQLIFTHSEEGDTKCLDLLPGEVSRLEKTHMGWDSVTFEKTHPITKDVPDGTHLYFCHSFKICPENTDVVAATTTVCPAIVAWDNVVGTQFHLEKSGKWGLKMLANFLQSATLHPPQGSR